MIIEISFYAILNVQAGLNTPNPVMNSRVELIFLRAEKTKEKPYHAERDIYVLPSIRLMEVFFKKANQ